MLNELLTQTWWTYDPVTTGGWGLTYRWFNLFEGTAWVTCALFVTYRWTQCGHSWVELLYAAAFFAFGLTDFHEASAQSAGLVIIKAANLIALGVLRWHVMRRYYPQSRLL